LNYIYRFVLFFGQRTWLKPQRTESLSQKDNSVHEPLLLTDRCSCIKTAYDGIEISKDQL